MWVSDHISSPPRRTTRRRTCTTRCVTLTWAAAATTTIGLGTSVLVAPQHHPLWLANTLASLDALSGGRLTVGVGVGLVGGRVRRARPVVPRPRPAHRRDHRRAARVLARRPVDFDGELFHLDRIRVLPKPAHDIPIWVGGTREAAYRRADHAWRRLPRHRPRHRRCARRGRTHPRDQPDPSFTISLRTGWDPQGMDPDLIRRERDEWEAAGLQHVVAAPWRNDPDD